MATAFCSWSVRDVKRWITSWKTIPSINASTITNMKSAADLHHIDGQKLIFITRDDLKECGLPKRDIQSAITRIDDLVLGAYLDYIFEHQYHFSEFIAPPQRHRYSDSKSSSKSQSQSPSQSNRHRRSSSSLSNSKYSKSSKANRSSKSRRNRIVPHCLPPKSPSKSGSIWKEGWILKKSENDVINHYDKRYMRLQGHYLCLYKRDITKYPRERSIKNFNLKDGRFRVEQSEKDRIKLYLINGADGNQRKFKAQSESDRNEWVQLIRKCIRSHSVRGIKSRDVNEFVVVDNEENQEAMDSVMNNKEVQNAAYSAMGDEDIRNSAVRAMSSGGNDVQHNRQLIGALSRNKAVQGAAISVAKDEKVQKAAYSTIKRNATMDNAKKAGRFMGPAAGFM